MPTNTADIRRYITQTPQPGLSNNASVNARTSARQMPEPCDRRQSVSRKRRWTEDLPIQVPEKKPYIERIVHFLNLLKTERLHSSLALFQLDDDESKVRLHDPDDVAQVLQRSKREHDDSDEDCSKPLTLPSIKISIVGTAGRSPTDQSLLSPYKTLAVANAAPPQAVHDATIRQQHIVEAVKKEAFVAQRVGELQREGMWAEKRLPKLVEPGRSKAHWDYCLEEIIWLSADFAQERKWKKALAKKCAKMVQKYFLDKQNQQRKEEKAQELRLRRISNTMAKEVKNFWNNVHKLVEYKQTTRLEEKRKQALDQHLSFIVDQTEKFSSMLAQSMNKSGPVQQDATPAATGSDDEFKPEVSSSDDEATIAKEEDEDERDANEIERLRNESEMPLDDLIPEEYLLHRDKDLHLSTNNEDVDIEGAQEEGDKDKSPNLKKSAQANSEDEGSESESEASELSQSDGETDTSANDDVSLKTLIDNKCKEGEDEARADKEMNDVTALAESIQPKGSTLLTTNVATKVPFLVKHPLREYQHIGLDWLVTMFDRKLNGILADEMGLGKTIQTIALLSHLACDKGNWGPHLIVVPTSVMLNWEMEFKKWCPAFKILTYYGSIRERKARRTGWTKENAFHICITSYKLVIQDHGSFRRKKWQYLVLDEAQNIKNFRSQRWQLLLNFHTARRLLLTGTPLQNNLMELWSLMHFLMPNVFQSHREFKEWFSNPVTGMLEGNSEYNDNIIKRLHKVLRPFLLRRLKTEVEKQLPKKYEHVVMCRLSKRQRYLYDDFMARAKTKETLACGNLLSVINVLMQLRKVCNHPNLFEVRPIISPFQMEGIVYRTASLTTTALDYNLDKHVNLDFLNLRLADAENLGALSAFLTWRQRPKRQSIEDLDALATAEPPRPPKSVFKINVCNRSKPAPIPLSLSKNFNKLAALPSVAAGRSPCIRLNSGAPVKVAGSEVHLIPGKQARLPVHLVQTASGRHMYFPLQSGSSPTANSVIANGQQLPVSTLKSASANTIQGMDVDVDVTGMKTLSVHVKRQPSPPTVRLPEPDIISPLHLPPMNAVEERRRARRAARLRSLAAVQERRCERYPMYGTDTVRSLRVVDQTAPSPAAWRWSGSAACYSIASARHKLHLRLWSTTNALADAVKSPQQLVKSLSDVLSRFVVYVPAVNAEPLSMHVSHPPPSALWRQQRFQSELKQQVAPRARLLHPIIRHMATQFPDPRLIQYDCGKLQVLNRLLRQLKSEHHKVLLFTQMTRMLDVLEAFLNCHGYIYLRLDGTTKVDQRQVLMERFNTDERIFVFILSTRSGGVGVNLTGADTVIFYDSDWNPTMDAQAQDRCHRIGQTRDVHIYRLVSEMTVEENILKKANQKRLLGDLAIEGGNFTTAFFKSQSTIQDLFNVDMTESDANKRMRQALGSSDTTKKSSDETENMGGDMIALGALESALATAEDATDVQAAETATAEAAAELAEFDENIPIEETPEAEVESRVEQEIQSLVNQLNPIEKYAMRYVEENEAEWSAEQLAAAEAQIEEQKKEWELNRQAAIEAEEARLRDDVESEEEQLTYVRHPSNEEWLNERSMNGLLMWCPPTPPQELDDVYIDANLAMLYQQTPMLPSELPPVFVKKDPKRTRTAETPSNLDMRRNVKISRRDDSPVSVQRTLFDHPGSSMNKMRRDIKAHKYRSLGLIPMASPMQSIARVPQPRDDNSPDWAVHEDFALLQAVEQLQELPLTMQVARAHRPNWDLIAEMVNWVSSCTRSPSQCRNRFENVILPREEGKIILDQRKQKKNKTLYKLPHQKTSRGLRTSQLNIQDNNASFTEERYHRIDNIKSLVAARKPNPKPQFTNPAMKNPKHFAVLTDSGINYDSPLNPVDIAIKRADRIAKERRMQALSLGLGPGPQSSASGGQSVQTVQVGQVPSNDLVAQRQLVAAASNKGAQVVPASVVVPAPTAAVNVTVVPAGSIVGTAQVISSGVATAVQATTASVPQTPTQSIVVTGHVTPLTTTQIQTPTITSMSSALRQTRPVSAIPTGLQEMVVAAGQARSVVGTSPTATVVSVANIQNARFSSGNLVTIPGSVVKGTVQMGTSPKTLTPTQMNFYRHQPIMRPQQRIGVREQGQQIKVVQGAPAKVTHVAQVQPGIAAQSKAPQFLKNPTLSTKGRTEEVAAIMKQQMQRPKVQTAQQQQQQLTAQLFTQVQGTTQVATLVKTPAVQNVTIPLPSIVSQVKGTLGTQLKTSVAGGQPMRLASYQQLLTKQNRQGRVGQLAKQTVPTQLIVQSQGTKTVSAINVQQYIKNSQPQHITVAAGQGMTGGGQVLVTKAGTASGATTLGTRVVPTAAGARQIQVVPGPIRTVSGVGQVTGSLKVTGSQQAFISQMAGLPIVRQGGNPVRIQTTASGTPIMAVAVQQQQQHTQPQSDQGQS